MEPTSMESNSGNSIESPGRCSGCTKGTRQATTFILSHIGLLSLVVGYCIMGAFIFEELEKYNELETKRSMKRSRLAVSDTIWEITRGMAVLHEKNWTTQVSESLRRFEKSLIIALKEKGWDGKENEETVTWSFAGALFYSITVITTIGYGHIAPKTPVGKIVTIFYAILGIPITVICWSNIGDAMANAFRFTYWKICCYVYTKKTKKRRKRMLSRHRAMSMRHPPSMVRRRSVRSRLQRPSQRSADSKVTTYTGDSKLTTLTAESRGTADSRATNLTVDSSTTQSSDTRSLPQTETKPILLQTQISEPSPTQPGLSITESIEVEPPGPEKPAALFREPSNTDASTRVLEKTETPEKTSVKISEKAGERMKEVSDKAGERMKGVSEMVLHKIRSAKKSANLSLEFDPNKLEIPKVSQSPQGSPDLEIPAGVQGSAGTEEMKGLSSRTRAILKAEKDSQKSQHSAASGGSNGYPGQNILAVPSVARGQRVARVIDDYDDQSYFEEYYYADSEDDLDDVSKRPVPILLSVLLVVTYIVGGAFLFQMWEGWSFLDSAYFCFITLTTIGFGDFTPDQKNVDGEQRIALCSIYLLFGIAMIAMSFNLVQEEVINSVKSVGKMLGIVKDNDDDDDY